MSRVQLALDVTDLDEAVEFSSTLFWTRPAKVRPGYATFVVADPPLKLVLIEDATRAPGSLNQLGVEVDAPEQVGAAGARLASAGLQTKVEEHTECCHAVQDKVWVDSPGGESWEISTVLADAETPASTLRAADPSGTTCCATRPDLTGVRVDLGVDGSGSSCR